MSLASRVLVLAVTIPQGLGRQLQEITAATKQPSEANKSFQVLPVKASSYPQFWFLEVPKARMEILLWPHLKTEPCSTWALC